MEFCRITCGKDLFKCIGIRWFIVLGWSVVSAYFFIHFLDFSTFDYEFEASTYANEYMICPFLIYEKLGQKHACMTPTIQTQKSNNYDMEFVFQFAWNDNLNQLKFDAFMIDYYLELYIRFIWIYGLYSCRFTIAFMHKHIIVVDSCEPIHRM